MPQPGGGSRARAGEALTHETTHALITDVPALGRLQQRALIIGFGGLVAGAVGAVPNLDQFFRSWLIGFLFCSD